ncbi:MAG TPA: hypothetical protein VEX60_06815 [Pyrinomonadaceae bacterium]|nr:hypothetical protein [Pyrinomonadaceae bacterium]
MRFVSTLDEKEREMIGKILLILGVLGVLLGGAVLLVSLLLPPLTNGRTSWEEAMLGIIPGAIVLIISFLIAAAGVVVIIMGRKNRQAG